MADLVPPAVANGGTGSVQVGGVRAPDYRQVQNPEQVRTDLPNSEAALRAQELSGLFKQFEGVSSDLYSQTQTKAGALAGAASGATGHPQYREGLNQFTAYSRAFNNAATGQYAIEAEAQADDSAARLRVQANNNPDTFRTTFTAVRDSVLKNAPPMAVPMLTELYNKHLANGLAAISGDQALQQQQDQRKAYDLGVERQTSRVAMLQGSDKPDDQLRALDEHAKLTALIDGGVNSGLYSVAEAQAMHINAMKSITAQVFETTFDKTLSTDGAAAAVDLLDKFQQQHIENLSDTTRPAILSEPEYQQLYAAGVTKLREYNLGIATSKRDGKTAEQLKFEAGDTKFTDLYLSGELTDKALATAVRNGDIRPERATALHSLLLNGPTEAKSNPRSLWEVKTRPDFLDLKTDDIASLSGVSTKDKLELRAEIERRKNGFEGTQAFKQGAESIGVALKIPPGTNAATLSDSERKAYAEAHQEYVQEISALDPSKRDGMASSVAQRVIHNIQQKQIQSQIQDLTNFRSSAIKNHGPGSAAQWDDERMKTYLKQKDDAIAALKAQLGK